MFTTKRLIPPDRPTVLLSDLVLYATPSSDWLLSHLKSGALFFSYVISAKLVFLNPNLQNCGGVSRCTKYGGIQCRKPDEKVDPTLGAAMVGLPTAGPLFDTAGTAGILPLVRIVSSTSRLNQTYLRQGTILLLPSTFQSPLIFQKVTHHGSSSGRYNPVV